MRPHRKLINETKVAASHLIASYREDFSGSGESAVRLELIACIQGKESNRLERIRKLERTAGEETKARGTRSNRADGQPGGTDAARNEMGGGAIAKRDGQT